MFIDELKIHLKAGRGGNGVERWLHLKGKEFSGPAGGNGGRGGNVIARGVRDIGILSKYRNSKELKAENGEAGRSKSQEGANGDNMTVDLPIGSVITNNKTGKKVELLHEGEEKILLRGGSGGLGNEHFKSSTNVKPMQWTAGKDGQEADFLIELELVVDAGFVGFPNAGKSSLLNSLTNAASKVAAYQFTTLEPNLGEFYGFILADIPGLIEGASEGKGLGYKFLRHIKRTKLILHCISLENEDIEKAYLAIRKELSDFDRELGDKEEVVILTKTDVTDGQKIKEAVKAIGKHNKAILTASILDDTSLKTLSDSLVKILKKAN
jgi:GTP-binding protein